MTDGTKPLGLKIIPWMWIGVGVFFCAVLGTLIKTLAGANGPGSGGALLLLPVAAAAYPFGLAWIGVGLSLFFGHRWSTAVASIASAGVVAFASALVFIPPAIPLAAALSAVGVATFAVLVSQKSRDYRAKEAALHEARLEGIRQGAEKPPVVDWLSRSWIAAGFLFCVSWPLSALYFRFFPGSGSVNEEFAYLVGFFSIPFGGVMMWIGFKLRSAAKTTVLMARLLLVLGLIGLIFDALAFPSVAVVSTIFFFYMAGWIALGRPTFKAYGEFKSRPCPT